MYHIKKRVRKAERGIFDVSALPVLSVGEVRVLGRDPAESHDTARICLCLFTSERGSLLGCSLSYPRGGADILKVSRREESRLDQTDRQADTQTQFTGLHRAS